MATLACGGATSSQLCLVAESHFWTAQLVTHLAAPNDVQGASHTVLPSWPNHRLGHPENHLFSLPKNIFPGSKYPKDIEFNFEKGSTVHIVRALQQHRWSEVRRSKAEQSAERRIDIEQFGSGMGYNFVTFATETFRRFGRKTYHLLSELDTITSSASFVAKISVSAPRKIFILTIYKKNLDQSIQKTVYLILKTEALITTSDGSMQQKLSVLSVNGLHSVGRWEPVYARL